MQSIKTNKSLSNIEQTPSPPLLHSYYCNNTPDRKSSSSYPILNDKNSLLNIITKKLHECQNAAQGVFEKYKE